MAKVLAYWHNYALGFKTIAYLGFENGNLGLSSYVLQSNSIQIVLTSVYPPYQTENNHISSYINQNYCGVKKVVLLVDSVQEIFADCIKNGALPIKFPTTISDHTGQIEEASIKLYDNSEIGFIERKKFKGIFKPELSIYQQL